MERRHSGAEGDHPRLLIPVEVLSSSPPPDEVFFLNSGWNVTLAPAAAGAMLAILLILPLAPSVAAEPLTRVPGDHPDLPSRCASSPPVHLPCPVLLPLNDTLGRLPVCWLPSCRGGEGGHHSLVNVTSDMVYQPTDRA